MPVMKLTREQKLRVLRLVKQSIADGLTRAEIARTLKPLICRSELYRLMDRYEQGKF